MRLIIRELRPAFSLLLTVWLTVVGLGVSLSHSHAAASNFHTHGLGWNRSCHSIPVDQSHHPGEMHRHLILFGLELPGEAIPELTTDSTSPLVSESSVVSDCECPPMTDIDLCLSGLASFETLFTVSKSAFLTLASPQVHLSAFALRAVAGVLRN